MGNELTLVAGRNWMHWVPGHLINITLVLSRISMTLFLLHLLRYWNASQMSVKITLQTTVEGIIHDDLTVKAPQGATATWFMFMYFE